MVAADSMGSSVNILSLPSFTHCLMVLLAALQTDASTARLGDVGLLPWRFPACAFPLSTVVQNLTYEERHVLFAHT